MGSIAEPVKVDVLIIGAGLSGLCALHHIRLRFPSWRVKVLEAGDSVGGTWYFNRYPGARFDSESVSYGYSWDKDLLNEWHWKEAYSPQPETLKYIRRVVEKHDLERDIQLNTRIKSATWEEDRHTWLFTDENGGEYRTTFFVSCIGFLSKATLPNVPGVNSFRGESFHTSAWPKEFVMSRDFANKRIGIIGTGATGIQTITEISKDNNFKSLHVFQRTANWSAPLRNTNITMEEMAKYRANYDSIFQRCAETSACFVHQADPRKSSDATEAERLALWDKLYAEPGFGKWLGSFKDTYTDRQANQLYSDYMAKKIRERLNDTTVAEKLIPKDHGFGLRRVPLESGYFEAYNRPNVHLVDLKETPIQQITPQGIETVGGKEYELDVLIYATGFDAITGSFSAIEWHGKDNRPLLGDSTIEKDSRAVWLDHRLRTFLGLTVPSMPNTFMVLGPHQPFGNATRSIEHAVQVISDLLQYCNDHGYTSVEATEEAVDLWTEHVVRCSEGALSNEIDSWMTGVNKNVAGKHTRSVARYAGHAVDYREKCRVCQEAGWKGLMFARFASGPPI